MRGATFIPSFIFDDFSNMNGASSETLPPIANSVVPETPTESTHPIPRDKQQLFLRCQQCFLSIFELIDIDRTESELLLPELIKLIKLLIEVSALGHESECHEKFPFWVDKMNVLPPASKLSQDERKELRRDLSCGYEYLQSAIIRRLP